MSAVVVRFSRARKRYEKPGILVEEAALERAEAQCLADEDARRQRRERDRQRRSDQDVVFQARLAELVGAAVPRCRDAPLRSRSMRRCGAAAGLAGRPGARSMSMRSRWRWSVGIGTPTSGRC